MRHNVDMVNQGLMVIGAILLFFVVIYIARLVLLGSEGFADTKITTTSAATRAATKAATAAAVTAAATTAAADASKQLEQQKKIDDIMTTKKQASSPQVIATLMMTDTKIAGILINIKNIAIRRFIISTF